MLTSHDVRTEATALVNVHYICNIHEVVSAVAMFKRTESIVVVRYGAHVGRNAWDHLWMGEQPFQF